LKRGLDALAVVEIRDSASRAGAMYHPRRRKRRILGAVLVTLAALVVPVNWTWGNLPGEPPRSGNEAQLGDPRVRYVERPGDAGSPASAAVEHCYSSASRVCTRWAISSQVSRTSSRGRPLGSGRSQSM
jgi:hypothetical protein